VEYFGLRERTYKESGDNFITRTFIICIHNQILSKCQTKEGEVGGLCRIEEPRKVLLKNLNGRHHSEDLV
jgi:hypothetical protein